MEPLRHREIWFDGRRIPLERRDIWDLVNNSALQKVVVTTAQRQAGHFPLKTELVTEVTGVDDLADLEPGETVLSSDPGLLKQARADGFVTCLHASVDSQEALERAWQEASRHDYAVVEFDLPTNIPLELILAQLSHRQTRILKKEETFEGMAVAFGVMEQGSDGVLLSTDDLGEILKVSRYLVHQDRGTLQLQPLVVSGTRHIGMGLRACVDTTGLLGQDEGMIVGSTSNGGIFICSETHYLPYMNLRPFRVNAGAVHSYIWMPNNTAQYLTDLMAGSRVLCVNTDGQTRALTVGRIKIEVRPLLLIEGEAAGQRLNVIVQDDWHIRVMGADKKPKNATELRPGDELLSYVCKPGRHVGIAVDETIIER
ncbi:MAG: 3-dehydroquinate synthase II [Bacillota bacterium]|nr:3-dehydroquinate synthase II [Bacillota bacterium]